MKKIVMMILLMLSTLSINALTLADLGFEEQLLVKDFVICLDDEITLANVEEFEGTHYNIILEAEEYIIVEKDGYYYIVTKSST